jgi:hypothetical protein
MLGVLCAISWQFVMVLIEYCCGTSTAIRRVALNKRKNELIVQYRRPQAPGVTSRVYLYYNIRELQPNDIEASLTSDISLGDYINREIKPRCQFRGVSNFPQNVQMYDYSRFWLEVVESPSISLEHLQSLLSFAQRFQSSRPPTSKPPRVSSSYAESKEPGNNEDDPSGRNPPSANIFDELQDSESDEDENVPNHFPDDIPVAPSDEGPSIQCRYLMVKIICGIAEKYREEAMVCLRTRQYVSMKELWESAYNILLSCQPEMDRWYAQMLSVLTDEESNDLDYYIPRRTLPDGHNCTQLLELYHAWGILIQDTSSRKTESIRLLTREESKLLMKLAPVLQERNHVRDNVIGIESWTSNAQPKQTYAERRRAWELALKEIQETLGLLQRLDFEGIVEYTRRRGRG